MVKSGEHLIPFPHTQSPHNLPTEKEVQAPAMSCNMAKTHTYKHTHIHHLPFTICCIKFVLSVDLERKDREEEKEMMIVEEKTDQVFSRGFTL